MLIKACDKIIKITYIHFFLFQIYFKILMQEIYWIFNKGKRVVMQNCFGLLVTYVMPIYMIIPRYSHNYAQFCQLLNSNLFTTVEYLCSWEKPLVKPMSPGSLYHHINLHHFITALLLLFTLHLYTKNTKNIIYHLHQISLS